MSKEASFYFMIDLNLQVKLDGKPTNKQGLNICLWDWRAVAAVKQTCFQTCCFLFVEGFSVISLVSMGSYWYPKCSPDRSTGHTP